MHDSTSTGVSLGPGGILPRRLSARRGGRLAQSPRDVRLHGRGPAGVPVALGFRRLHARALPRLRVRPGRRRGLSARPRPGSCAGLRGPQPRRQLGHLRPARGDRGHRAHGLAQLQSGRRRNLRGDPRGARQRLAGDDRGARRRGDRCKPGPPAEPRGRDDHRTPSRWQCDRSGRRGGAGTSAGVRRPAMGARFGTRGGGARLLELGRDDDEGEDDD